MLVITFYIMIYTKKTLYYKYIKGQQLFKSKNQFGFEYILFLSIISNLPY